MQNGVVIEELTSLLEELNCRLQEVNYASPLAQSLQCLQHPPNFME